jgi:hypothetical protein
LDSKDDSTAWGLVFLLFWAGILSAFQVGKVPLVLSDIMAHLAISLFDAGCLLPMILSGAD